jgi:hypothetical protein
MTQKLKLEMALDSLAVNCWRPTVRDMSMVSTNRKSAIGNGRIEWFSNAMANSRQPTVR